MRVMLYGWVVLVMFAGGVRGEEEKGDKIEWISSEEELARVAEGTKSLTIWVRGSDDELMAAVVKRFPSLEELNLKHMRFEMDIGNLRQVNALTALRILEFSGDARLGDEEFRLLGKNRGLKSLRLQLPCPVFTEERLAMLGPLTALEFLDMRGCRGEAEELEATVWEAIEAEKAAELRDGATE
jgi:hypothetical protein